MSDPKTMGPFYANTYISQSHHCFTLHLECILRRDLASGGRLVLCLASCGGSCAEEGW